MGYNNLFINLAMPDSLYGVRLQGFMVDVFIIAKSRAWFDEYIYHDSLQARVIEGIGHSITDFVYKLVKVLLCFERI